ncbi:hypothetical protein GCM10010350_71750 [Streptomyces galilaeus]|nr:hypothetical protein GCM10010350_71750 [Streptomyces galilaeus]
MIHTRTYRLLFPPDRPSAPIGISLDVPVLRRRLLRIANYAAKPAPCESIASRTPMLRAR